MTLSVDRSLGPATASELRALYETHAWWADREAATIERALAATDEVVALRDEETGRLVAAARVLTDYTYYAMVYDVIVHDEYRSEGVGTELMAALETHPPLSNVDLGLLARDGLVPFYESCGFQTLDPVAEPHGRPEELRPMAFRRER